MKSQYIMEKGCLVVYVPRELDHHQANRIRTETDLLIDTANCASSCTTV